MDFSKLPKFSQSQEPTPASPESTPAGAAKTPASGGAGFCPACGAALGASARFCESCGAPTVLRAARAPGAGADTWISIAMGVILLFLFPHLIQFLVHPGTTAFDATDNQTGAVIPYAHSAFIWPDVGVTFFCLLLIVEPLLMLAPPKRLVALVGAGLGACCALLNLFVVIKSMNVIGFQLVCAVAAAFSIYITIQRWTIFRLT